MSAPSLLPLACYGVVLGWSVAWPPGPINAEIIRRGLARGFWPACAVGFGASTGDALWALLVVLGAGVLFASAAARLVLAAVSTLLLLILALLFLCGAARSYAAWRAGEAVPPPRALEPVEHRLLARRHRSRRGDGGGIGRRHRCRRGRDRRRRCLGGGAGGAR